MELMKEKYENVLVEIVNLERATLKEAEQFKTALSKDIEEGNKNLIVDLNSCEFIDSTFLGALVVSLKKATSLGGDLKLVGFKPAVHSMFELTRLHRVFEAFRTREDAVNSFN
jgi:anti-sigma B factor antagonist